MAADESAEVDDRAPRNNTVTYLKYINSDLFVAEQ